MELFKVHTVLIVNNSSERLGQLQVILQRAGCYVLQALDSKAACRTAFEQLPALILIEETDSAADQALVLRLREIDRTASIPILLTTSAPALDLVPESKAANPYPSDSLTIPYDEFQLVATVSRLIATSAAGRTLNTSREHYRQLFERANDIVYTIDRDGRYTSINQRGLDITGYSAEDMTRLTFEDIANPEDVARGNEMFRRKLERGTLEPTIYEINIKTKTGELLPIEINSQLIFNEDGRPVGVQGIARDISKRKADEAALKEANERAIKEYRQLLRRISELAQTVGTARDVDTIFQSLVRFTRVSLPCSTLVLALYELEHNEVRPQFVWTPDGTNDIRGSKPLLLNGGTPGTVVLSKKIHISDSTTQKFQSLDPALSAVPADSTVMTVPMIVAERVVALLEVHADLANAFDEEHKNSISMAANIAGHGIENLRLLARDRERENQLKQAQKMEALGRLAGGVAHDFNNILTALFGYCDLSVAQLEDRKRPLDRQTVIDYIESAKELAERATLFTKQLLAFSRGQILEPHSLDLNKTIQDFAPLTLARLIGENIKLRYNLADNLPAVYLDSGQIQQIILNLAINARDAMPKGGEITIETRVVQPKEPGHKPAGTKDPQRPQVIMQFSDTGCGIDSETQKQIFEPFFTTKGLGGTGLGLAVVYSSIKQAGGTISCTSQLNRGTTFTIRFPAADTPPERALPPQFDSRVNRNISYTILLAEDDKSIRHTLSTALRSAGYDVSTADNGQQALELFERDADYFDLLITDLLMPEMSGPDLSSRIRKIKPHLPLLYISGYPADILQEGGSLPRETQFIAKPFSHKEILRKIDDMLYHLQDEVAQ